jgi:hypothetical protein
VFPKTGLSDPGLAFEQHGVRSARDAHKEVVEGGELRLPTDQALHDLTVPLAFRRNKSKTIN